MPQTIAQPDPFDHIKKPDAKELWTCAKAVYAFADRLASENGHGVGELLDAAMVAHWEVLHTHRIPIDAPWLAEDGGPPDDSDLPF